MGKPQNGKKNGAQGMSPAKAIQQGQVKKNKQEKFKKTPVGKVQVINGKTNGNAVDKKQANNASPAKKQQQNNQSPKKNNNKKNNNKNQKNQVPAPKQNKKNKKAAVVKQEVVKQEDDESETTDIDENVPLVPEIVSEEEDDDTDSDSDGETAATPAILLGQSLAEDSDEDDEDFDDEEEEKEVVSKNGKKMGVKPFKGVQAAEAEDSDDLNTTGGSSVNSSMVTDEDDEDDDDDDDDDEDDEDDSGLKALIGDSIIDSENDEDFEENEEDDDDDDDDDDEEDEEDEDDVDDKDLNQSATSIVEVKNNKVQLLSADEKAEQDKRTIFIGNVPVAVDEKKIRATFKSFGPIDSIRIRGIIPESPKVSKKVAAITKKFHPKSTAKCVFIVFKTADSVDKALSLNGTQLDGNYLRVDRANANREVDAKKSIFLGNLPFDLEDNELWEMFNKCGKVESVRSIRDRITGCCRGLAYVNFAKEDSVALALNLNGQKIKNREIRVFPYKPDKKAKRARSSDSTGSSPAKKTKREIAIAKHHSQGAEQRISNNNKKRSQGQQKRSMSADGSTTQASPKPSPKATFRGKKANDKKPFNKAAFKAEKQKQNMAAKLTAKPKKPVKN